jgi:hypothetical protein
MLIECQPLLNYACNVNIRLFNIPESILAASKSTDLYLSSQQSWILFVTAVFKGVLDVRDDSVSDFKVLSRHTLFFVDLSNN